MAKRKRKVVLNGQSSSWTNVKTGVPQGYILGPLLFLTYIKDLGHGLSPNINYFANDTSLFSVTRDLVITNSEHNSGLARIK